LILVEPPSVVMEVEVPTRCECSPSTSMVNPVSTQG